MEVSNWHLTAQKKGAKLKPYMQLGNWYIYQLYTSCFVEFDTLDKLLDFRRYADKNIPYWDYDPVCIINTNDSKDIEYWKNFIEE